MRTEDERPTVPPPAGGDAYSAETTVRQAPEELLEAIRKNKGDAVAAPPPALVPVSAPPVRFAPIDATRRTRRLTMLALVIALLVATAAVWRHLHGW
jgi:hypothetical protein